MDYVFIIIMAFVSAVLVNIYLTLESIHKILKENKNGNLPS